ncbi:EUKARYOTIC ASPARTYL PROTEASE FAMILY PROTEIN [Salix koriyanagi]|uniref:EUKARYOTIC ASPARTYL PROTEASE FAMILY PROTEIN n=1 Tax=Salix koriyanagi TaxID=2511006 RepID=A0A9Q0VGP1_9ROSI|nr:EUKARYOTIC ASPARTYL PROTEASE FAMILY PROTEIN [Salix koriyanagi]
MDILQIIIIPGYCVSKGIAGQELQGFPSMTFHLANGADLVVDAGGLFYQADQNSFCLSIQPQVQPNFPSIIGITAQQDYNVAFDLDERNIYFQGIDCEVLDD